MPEDVRSEASNIPGIKILGIDEASSGGGTIELPCSSF